MIEKKLPWVLVAVLTGLLIIITFLWVDALGKIGGGNLTAQRDIIRESCAQTDDESRARCSEELAELQTMLEKFAEDLEDAALPQATVQFVATSTPQGQ
jgi:hypothetical protein